MYKVSDQFDIKAIIKKVAFKSTDSFYKVLSVSIQTQANQSGGSDYLAASETLTGDFPLVSVGDMFEATVMVKRHPRYGYSLSMVGQSREVKPANEQELTKYMTRKLKGVGIKTAQKIVDAFSMDAIKVIEQKGADALTSIGLSKLKAEGIYAQIGEQYAFARLNEFLFRFNIPTAVAIVVYEKLGMDSLSAIGQNPYVMSRHVADVPFFYPDIVAQSLGRPVDSPERLKSVILEYVQQRNEGRGDVFVPKVDVLTAIYDYMDDWGDYLIEENLTITPEQLNEALNALVDERVIVIEEDEKEQLNVYLTPFARIEAKIVKNVTRLLVDTLQPLVDERQAADYLDKLQTPLSATQRGAVETALSHNLTILTGGPGTGKTYTTNLIVNTLMNVNPTANVALLAPTGKASKRLSELTQMEAMTIHRKLKIYDSGDTDEYEMVEEDLVVVDEVSMVDAVLFNKLMNNLGEQTRVLLVGDVEQLPSIGAGLILKDLIDSGVVPVVQLTDVFRQAQDSQIIMNAHKLIKGVKKGDNLVDDNQLTIDNQKGDMFWIERADEKSVRDMILYSVKAQMEQYGHAIEDIVVLSPMKQHGLGTYQLNDALQQQVNPPAKDKPEVKVERDHTVIYRLYDRVIHLTNNVDKGVTNGEVGTITGVYSELNRNERTGAMTSEQIVEVEYSADKSVRYTLNELNQLELAYAMTIHKSQGSEFPIVIMPIHSSHVNMLQRNLIYTGWTRVKQKLILIGDTKVLNKGIDSINGTKRHTRIREKLQLNVLLDTTNLSD